MKEIEFTNSPERGKGDKRMKKAFLSLLAIPMLFLILGPLVFPAFAAISTTVVGTVEDVTNDGDQDMIFNAKDPLENPVEAAEISTTPLHLIARDKVGNSVALTNSSATLPGDANGDFKVDGKDMALIAKYFGSTGGHPTNADLNADGKVDGGDTAIVAKNFGQIPGMWNGLTITLDTLQTTDTPQAIIDYMNQYQYNALRVFTGWWWGFKGEFMYSGDTNNPLSSTTQTFLTELLSLCAQENFKVVMSISLQNDALSGYYGGQPNRHPEWVVADEVQTGYNGETCYLGNYMDPVGPIFRTFSVSLTRQLVRLATDAGLIPRISVDEVQYVSARNRAIPALYSPSMKAAYLRDTGLNAPSMPMDGTRTAKQRNFLEYCKQAIMDFYEICHNAALAENPISEFCALLDTYWVEYQFVDETQPYEYYSTLDSICYEWFSVIENADWTGLRNGMHYVKSLNPYTPHLYFLYGVSKDHWAASVNNMRQAVQIALEEGYHGVFMFQYAYARDANVSFSVRDITREPPQE